MTDPHLQGLAAAVLNADEAVRGAVAALDRARKARQDASRALFRHMHDESIGSFVIGCCLFELTGDGTEEDPRDALRVHRFDFALEEIVPATAEGD